MNIAKLTTAFAVSEQVRPEDMSAIAGAGYRSVFCHRPDGEGADQPNFIEIELAAKAHGLQAHYLPVVSGKISDDDVRGFGKLLADSEGPVLAYCRSGMRAATLWALDQAPALGLAEVLAAGKNAGYDLSALTLRMADAGAAGSSKTVKHTVVIVGAGAAGIAVAASLRARDRSLDIVIIDPADIHYYQPGWTMVGGGVFRPETTARSMAPLIPNGVKWIKAAVAGFDPTSNQVILEGCQPVAYESLIVCPGIKLNWQGIEGLQETLGQHGVTSNYRFDLAPYTWKLVSEMTRGHAVFTQPPMPIKCAGAPQKAMYLSADHWRRTGRLKDIDIDFFNAGAVLFGVKEYVPALMGYVERYGARLNFNHRLVRIDGPGKRAWFEVSDAEGNKRLTETDFDMIHVVPPQMAPDFVRASPLADNTGWVDINPDTLQHKKFPNIYALGDAANSPNAKTAAAARKQAPVVATNVLFDLGRGQGRAAYDGYGSCPLTVERGRIVLAEFGYGGRLLPSFPKWFIDGTQPTRLAWLLKEQILPPIYWKAMLKGREWLANPLPLKEQADKDA